MVAPIERKKRKQDRIPGTPRTLDVGTPRSVRPAEPAKRSAYLTDIERSVMHAKLCKFINSAAIIDLQFVEKEIEERGEMRKVWLRCPTAVIPDGFKKVKAGNDSAAVPIDYVKAPCCGRWSSPLDIQSYTDRKTEQLIVSCQGCGIAPDIFDFIADIPVKNHTPHYPPTLARLPIRNPLGYSLCPMVPISEWGKTYVMTLDDLQKKREAKKAEISQKMAISL